MIVTTQEIDIKHIELNVGQIEGLPKNPRFIKDDKYEKLKQSLIDDPEMMQIRECIVVASGKKYVLIGGNMRYRALKELGHKTIICKVLPENTPIQKLKSILIKDNENYGEWDFDELANGEWDLIELDNWGVDFPNDLFEGLEDEAAEPEKEQSANRNFVIEVIENDEDSRQKAYNKLIELGYNCRLKK